MRESNQRKKEAFTCFLFVLHWQKLLFSNFNICVPDPLKSERTVLKSLKKLYKCSKGLFKFVFWERLYS